MQIKFLPMRVTVSFQKKIHMLSINLAQSLAWRLLLMRFHFVEQVNTLTTKNSIEYDADIFAPLMAGLSHCKKSYQI
jgi:hypothetical protein